jgi:hypothetical protein
MYRIPCHGKIEIERGAFSRAALDADFSGVFLNNSIGD